METTIDIKLGGLGQLKAELTGIKDQLAGLTPNTEEWTALQDKAGDIKKKITSINSGISDLSKGSNIEQATESFNGLGESLLNLDFSGAAKQASRFQQTMGSLSAADIAKPFKSMISIVGSLSKAFIQFGVSLLANPIFLLVAAIVAIVVAIGLFLNKLGLLKPILDAIGKVFGWIMDVINGVIEAFKTLTDWLGLTSHAANESAQAQADAAEKVAKAHEEKSATIVQGYDHEIAMAKINGKSTEYLEKKKAFWIMETMKARMIADKEAVKSAILIGDLDEEEIAKLEEKAKASTLAYKGQVNSTKQLIAQQSADKKAALLKDQEEEDKATGEAKKKAQEAYKARIAAEKQFRADRLAAIRQIEDLENSLMAEGITKELTLNEDKYKRILEDLETNAKLTADEKIRLANLYAEEEFQNEKAIRDKYQADLDASITSTNEKRVLAAQTQKDLEIQTAKDIAASTFAIAQKQAADNIKLEQDVLNAKKQMGIAAISVVAELATALAGKSEASQKRAFAINKAASIAQATISTYQAATGAYASQMALLTPDAPIRAAVAAGIAVASGLAKVAVIAKTKFGGGTPSASSGGGSSSGGGGSTSTQAATPAVNLFGANNNANTFGATGQQQSNQPMMVKAVVVESDITKMQTKINKIQESAVL